jgi:hypothetical protein
MQAKFAGAVQTPDARCANEPPPAQRSKMKNPIERWRSQSENAVFAPSAALLNFTSAAPQFLVEVRRDRRGGADASLTT